MKIPSLIYGALTAACAMGIAFPQAASAQVSTNDFEALKKMVEQMGDRLQKLEQTHEQDQKTHEQDQQVIQQLQKQLGETKTAVTNAQLTADNVAKAQAAFPAPGVSQGPMHNFTIVGDAEVQFGKTAGQHSAFQLADFAPVFLFRASDDVLFEAGFDTMLNNNTDVNGNRAPGSSTSLNLSFATLDYLLNDHMTLQAGEMLLPLGTYSERNAGWLNKIPDNPLVCDDLIPGSGVGAQLRGAIPVGQSGQMVTYAAYAVNGPSSGASNSIANAGALDLGGNVGSSPNWHPNPSGGGRLGWFYPWKPHYDFELGLSGQTGEWSDSGNRQWSAGVVDAALHLGPNVEVKGQYVNTWVETDDIGKIDPKGWYVQASYKLAGLKLELPYINNFELVSRYDRENDDGLFGGGAGVTKTDRYTAGLIYYFSNTLLFEADYEWWHSRGPTLQPFNGPGAPNSFVLQLSYGF
ncbi:MAG TPA: porin [Candidatus Acidoferrum sp.]|nr:porin [Candidatus Acidoferrum sp.]